MKSIKLNNGMDFYYYDREDPVINALKNGNLFGLQNWNTLSSLVDLFDRSGCIVDAGAHIGTFAAASLFCDVEFVLIEADEENIECLQKTFGSRKNVDIVNTIIHNKNGRADFSERRGPFGWIVENEEGKYQTLTLDFILKDREVAAIKLDIEGNEIAAIDGCSDTLKQKPVMMVEVNGYCLMQQNKTSNDLLRKLYSIGYDCFIQLGESVLKINPNEFFPFCVIDVIAIHNSQSSVIDSIDMTGDIANNIYSKIKDQMNGDCKSYFDWIES